MEYERTKVQEAIDAWEAKGATSLTVGLMADALYGAAREIAEARSEGWSEARSELLPQMDAIKREWQAKAWDEGRAAERRDWEFTFDLATPDEDRQPWPNPYRGEDS